MRKKWSKAVMAILVATGIVVSGLTFDCSAEEVGAKTTEKTMVEESELLDFSREESSVIYLRDAADWNMFARGGYGNSVNVKLANDISFDGVSNDNYRQMEKFSGTFDGCGYTMSGMISTNYSGLFNTIQAGGKVKNVIIADSVFKRGSAFVASVNAGTIDNCHVKNCKLKGTEKCVGGIVGDNYEKTAGTILNCTVDSRTEIEGPNAVGGIAAKGCGGDYLTVNGGVWRQFGWELSEINNCANMATLKGKYVGGVCAFSGTVNNSYNVGKLSVTGDKNPGGIVYSPAGVIWNCYYVNDSSNLEPWSAGSSANSQYWKKTRADMQSQSFCNELNKNRGDKKGWFDWEINPNSTYPVITKLKDISGCNINLSATNIPYTGEEITPAISVSADGKKLVREDDYTVTYSDNIGVGTAKIIIEGTGIYTKSVEKTFQIVKGTPAYSWSKPKKTYVAGSTSFSLNFNAKKGNLGKITYHSSNSKVISVTNNGYLSFRGVGKAKITIKYSGDKNWNGNSIVTHVISVKPAKPKVHVIAGKKNMTISWKKTSGVKYYEYRYSLKKNLNGVKLYKTKKGKAVVKKLKKGKTYYVQVRAVYNNEIKSEWSSKKTVKIK